MALAGMVFRTGKWAVRARSYAKEAPKVVHRSGNHAFRPLYFVSFSDQILSIRGLGTRALNEPNTSMRTSIITLLLATALAACTSEPTTDPRVTQLEEDGQRLNAKVSSQDSTINDLFGTLNQISENLRTIRSKQGQLVSPETGIENGVSPEDRIMGDIASIDSLLTANRSLIDKLRKQARSNTNAIAELERTVADLEQGLKEKDAEIATLKEQLSSTNSSLATLIEMYRDKSQLSDMQRNELNTAFYAVGTSKELRENGVLTKEGGVVGLGGVNKLNTADLKKDYFTQIDIMRTQEIALAAKKAKLVTTHPEGSYKLDLTDGKLVITDANKFWSISKYLVVVVE